MPKHTGAMIAAIPRIEDAKRIYVEGGTPLEELHLTLCFLGEASNYNDISQGYLTGLVNEHITHMTKVTGEAFSINLFNPNAEEPATVLGVGGEDLKSLYNCVWHALEIYGLNYIPKQHSPWVPHITIAYDDYSDKIDELTSKLGTVVFDRIRIVFGDNSIDIPLQKPDEEVVTMSRQISYLADTHSFELSEDNSSNWVHALPIGSYSHPVYGALDITVDKAKKIVDNVINKVRGIDPSINYNHTNSGPDAEAAGWVKNAEVRSDGVWVFVEWVKDAAEAIKAKKWRYFSIEYVDSWTNPEGMSFNDVLIGGALTNRPFMKNLVPINLSEATYDMAFDIVSTVTGTPMEELRGGKEVMELSESDLNKIIEGVASKLGDKTDSNKSVTSDPIKLSEIAELKQLAEDNPLVKTLVSTLENQGLSLVENAQKLRETQVARALAEFDKSELVLTPVARNLVQNLLLKMSDELADDFWKLMDHMRKSQSFLVDLSEKAGVPVRYGVDRSPAKKFNELVNKHLAQGVSYPDAVEKVASDNRELYEEYRQESFSFKN